MRGRRHLGVDPVLEVQQWFKKSVTYKEEPYTIDYEQAEAVLDGSKNTIVVARAGSGKTRTIVAKIVFLIAKRGLKPEEIMVFVFNANAAAEINARLGEMRVDGVKIMSDVKVASTFHAFSRKVVYDVCGGRKKCGKILASEKEEYMLAIIMGMMQEEEWRRRIVCFVKGDEYGKNENAEKISQGLELEELKRMAKMMTLFVNRAQQKYLGGEETVGMSVRRYLEHNEVRVRERVFIKIGLECYRRYHWCLLDEEKKMVKYSEYGTDFNLIVSWASKLILGQRGGVKKLLSNKKYILVDEYQDFSQLFLSAVKAIRSVATHARLFVVGDDLQAINRFAGSEVEFFKEFERFFPEDVKRLQISTNYRCDREIVGVARRFMKKGMGEKGEFRAFSRRMGKVGLVDAKETACKVALVDYDKRVSQVDGVYMEMTRMMLGREPKKQTVRYMKTIVDLIRKNRKMKEILILHRNNEINLEGMSLMDLEKGLKWGLGCLGIMSKEEFATKVRIMTMHKSKGLESEMVIIMEADEGVIPKTHPDTSLYAVFGETEAVALDDQKRLFYVAMTRAKKRLYIMHDNGCGEGFIKYLGWGVEK